MDSFYITTGDGHVLGPYTPAEIRQRIEDQTLNLETLQVCAPESDEWTFASEHSKLGVGGARHSSDEIGAGEKSKNDIELQGGCIGCLFLIGIAIVLVAIGVITSKPKPTPIKTPVERYLEKKDLYDRLYK